MSHSSKSESLNPKIKVGILIIKDRNSVFRQVITIIYKLIFTVTAMAIDQLFVVL